MHQALWQTAAAYAAQLHEHEKRDDEKTPYFSHPARVAMTLRHLFTCDDDAALAAAFLHDTMENTDEGYDALERRFGEVVADMVVALTKNMMLPFQQREKEYMERLAKADWRARLVKLADMYDNMTDALAGKKDGVQEEAAKCRDIMALTKADAKRHEETARALRLLKKLLKRSRKR
jgi:(p)ppGpp synthase/HD superfamily hydrolase